MWQFFMQKLLRMQSGNKIQKCTKFKPQNTSSSRNTSAITALLQYNSILSRDIRYTRNETDK